MCRLLRRLSAGMIAVASTIAATSIALAADMPTKAPAYAPAVPAPYNWTGSYVGGHFGYGWGGDAIELSSLTAFAVGAVPSSLTDNPRGVLGGIQYGTNWQFNRFVLGWDSDFSFTDIKASQTLVTVPAGVATTTSGEQKLDWFSTTRGRLGYLLTDNLMLYGTGGLASGRASANTFISQAGCPVGFCLAGNEFEVFVGLGCGRRAGICGRPLVTEGGIPALRSRRFELQRGRREGTRNRRGLEQSFRRHRARCHQLQV